MKLLVVGTLVRLIMSRKKALFGEFIFVFIFLELSFVFKTFSVFLYSAIVLHSTTRLIPILQQLQNGMQLYGLVDQLSKNSELCKPLFVPGKIKVC